MNRSFGWVAALLFASACAKHHAIPGGGFGDVPRCVLRPGEEFRALSVHRFGVVSCAP